MKIKPILLLACILAFSPLQAGNPHTYIAAHGGISVSAACFDQESHATFDGGIVGAKFGFIVGSQNYRYQPALEAEVFYNGRATTHGKYGARGFHSGALLFNGLLRVSSIEIVQPYAGAGFGYARVV